MTRPVSVGIVVLVVAVALAGISGPLMLVGATDTADPQPSSDADAAPSAYASNDVDSQDFDSTTFEITVHENGSATWTFRYEQQLDGSSEEQNFETFAEEFGSEETGLYERFIDQSEAMTETGKEMTDREMEAKAFNRTASVEYRPSAIGVVEMSFVWDGFADVEDDQIVAGDVFRNMYLGEDQSIVIQPDDGLVFTDADPEGEYAGSSMEDASSMTWSGEYEFLDGHPQVVLQDADDVGGDSATGNAGSTNNGDGVASWTMLVGFAVLALGAGAAVVWYRDRQSDDEAGLEESTRASPPSTEPTPESEADEADGTAVADTLAEDDLLTDEDRVLKLIRENGGRMKQVNIVEETGWSKSKVSMLLSDMESEGSISKLRVGRENIISLEGFEPEATKSPFDEQ
jgi:hypothetical protein